MADQIIRIPMEPDTPTRAEYQKQCTDTSMEKPSCVIKVIEFDGEAAPGFEPSELRVVSVPVKPDGGGCDTKVSVWMTQGCPADPELSWDVDESSETITSDSSVVIAIKDGLGVYHWELLDDAGAGTGFSLAVDATEIGSFTNLLYADEFACGMAHIRVTDECDTVVTGKVRCTDNGHWHMICDTLWDDPNCEFDALGWDEIEGDLVNRLRITFRKTEGDFRYSEWIRPGEGSFHHKLYWEGCYFAASCTRFFGKSWQCFGGSSYEDGDCDENLDDGCDGMYLDPYFTCGDLINVCHGLGWTDMIVTNSDELGPCCENVWQPDYTYLNEHFCFYPIIRQIEEWIC